MAESLLVRVRSRAIIPAHRRVRTILDGEYGSIHRGRSMEFDDLRDYVPGDDAKDIDWKATARHPTPLIKRYVAVRQHGLLLVVDTGREMAALAEPTTTKRDLAIIAAGVLGQLAVRHGDLVGLIAGPGGTGPRGISHVPLGKGAAHLERILRVIDRQAVLDGEPSALDGVLSEVARMVRRRLIVVVICGDDDITDRRSALLRRLRAQHELLMLTVADLAIVDAHLAPGAVRVLETGRRVPAFLGPRAGVHAELAEHDAARQRALTAGLAAVGVAHARLRAEGDVVGDIIGLLERRRRARR